MYCLSAAHVFTVDLESMKVTDKGAPSLENVWMGTGAVVTVANKAYFVVFEKVVFSMSLENFSLEMIRKGEI